MLSLMLCHNKNYKNKLNLLLTLEHSQSRIRDKTAKNIQFHFILHKLSKHFGCSD